MFGATLLPSPERLASVLSHIVTSAMHPFTAILIETNDDGKLRDARVEAVSTDANRLFDYGPNSRALHHKKLADLLERIQSWMNPEDFQRFVEDQTNNSAAFAEGTIVFANVPIKFTNGHPDRNFRNKRFLPFVVGFTEPATGRIRYATVLYINLDDLPREDMHA